MIQGFVKLYKEKGLNVMPLKPRSKFPSLDEWKKYQTEKYTGDFAPDQNGAVICGKSSGNLVVIDLDDRNLQTIFDDWERLKKETLVVETGKKGYHIYVKPKEKLPERSIRATNEKGQHLDIQSHGTYVLIPGSIHPDTGEEYKIISSTLDIKEIDLDGLLEKLTKLGFNIKSKGSARSKLREGVKEGQRDDTLFKAGIGLRYALGENEISILTVLEHANQTKVFPPLPDLDIKRITASVMGCDIKEPPILQQIIDDYKKQEKKYELKYNNSFWKEIGDYCKQAGISRNDLIFHCINCKAEVPNDPTNEDHKTHLITIKYK